MNLRMLMLALALAAGSQTSLANDKPTGKDVESKVEDAGKTIGSYTIAERDKAVKSAQKALADMDARLNRIEKKVGAEWGKMDAAARKDTQATMKGLHRRRNETAAWLGKLQKSSAESWDEVKGGFVKSYESLKQSLAKASN